MIRQQRTLAKEVHYEGIGLHSGLPVKMTLRPAEADTGIVFVRTDLEGTPSVRAAAANVTNTMRATTLESGAAKVFTVEHLMSAFSGMEVDNCYVDLDSPEPPIADGGAAVFVGLIEDAGAVDQGVPADVYAVKRSHAVYDGDRFIAILPYDGFRITFTSMNPHPMLGTQHSDFTMTPEIFAREIAPARTIGFTKELEALQAMGLAKGGSTENALVYDEESCLSVPIFEDELVRHKILDIMGDLFLLGCIRGHIVTVKSSHDLNARLARKIAEEMKEEQR